MRAIILTGVYGSGKTSVAVEIADILHRRGEPYAVLDLDWLLWFRSESGKVDSHAMMLRNLAPIVANYREVGVRTFVLARSIADRDELDSLRAVLGMPAAVIRLTVPEQEIERRIGGSLHSGRQEDLAVARRWIAEGTGAGLEDLTVANAGRLGEVAAEVLLLTERWFGYR